MPLDALSPEEIAAQLAAVLDGKRLGLRGKSELKMLRISFGNPEGADIHIAPDRITMWWGRQSRKPFSYFASLGPGLLSRLLKRGRIEGAVREPLVTRISFVDRAARIPAPPQALWIFPDLPAVQVYRRVLPPELLPTQPQPVPASGPLARPEPILVVPFVPSRRIRTLEAPQPCPICQEISIEFRDISGGLVCLRCHRSFADPGWR